MKTTYSQILLNLIVCLSLFTLSNCKDNCSDKKIPLKDLNTYVPYTGNDTLRFLRNSTDTQTFVGQGLERFYITDGPSEDDDCPEDYESVRIRFVNPQTQDEIKMEYAYYSYQNTNIFIFYYKNKDVGSRLFSTLKNKVEINSFFYDYVNYYSESLDTLSYLAFRSAAYPGYGGILKIKYPGDTLTLLR